MREIKFRAWEKPEYKFGNSHGYPLDAKGVMYTGFSFKDIYSGYDEASTACDDGQSIEEPKWDKLILMQYTGLKDKNGKEIYEGDIIELTSEDSAYIEGLYEVYFDTELLEFGVRNSHALFHVQFSPEFEVIGNIYENPELLKNGE